MRAARVMGNCERNPDLEVKESSDESVSMDRLSRGLFARREFHEKETIGLYTGERKKKMGAEYGKDDEATYWLQTLDKTFIDASDPAKSSIMRYMNMCLATDGSCANNAKFEADDLGNIFVTALGTIPAGQEIFVDYYSGGKKATDKKKKKKRKRGGRQRTFEKSGLVDLGVERYPWTMEF
jgi:hypothetical protein